MITRLTSVTDQTRILTDHILTNSLGKFSLSGVIDLDLSDYNLIYCTIKTSLHKSRIYNRFMFAQ